jgi:hypothetical protein
MIILQCNLLFVVFLLFNLITTNSNINLFKLNNKVLKIYCIIK